MKTLLLLSFIFALFSILFWAFTGLTLWAPMEGPNDGRSLVLGFLHVIALIAYPIAYIETT